MSGHHNLKIYTLDDNPFCSTCKNGELVKSAWTFREGGYLCCHPKGVPTNEGCEGYTPASQELVKKFKTIE